MMTRTVSAPKEVDVKGARTIIAVAAMAALLVPCAAHAEGVFDNLILSPRARAMGGAFVAARSGQTFETVNPATEETLARVSLEPEAWNRPLKTYSRGMLQRTAIAAAILTIALLTS